MSQSCISIIVPVYNAEKYIDKCVKSIIEQTYKNLEIILIDDGSSDNCPQICDNWTQKDPRIKVIHKANGGVSSARNEGLEIFTGDYVTFVDSDDWVEKDYVSIMVENSLSTGADIVVSSFVMENLSEGSETVDIEDGFFEGKEIISKYLLDKIRPEACGKMIKSDIIRSIRFDENFGYAEDLLFNYNVLKYCKKLSCINVHKYHYVQNSGNSSTTAFITDNRAKSYMVFEKILNDCSSDKQLFNNAVWRFTVGTFAIISRVMLEKSYSEIYFNEIAAAIVRHKKEIAKNNNLGIRHKTATILLSLNKNMFKTIFVLLNKIKNVSG